MNFDFAEQINPDLEKLDFKKAISTGETELQKLPTTAFHSIIGKTLTGQAESLAVWVDNFYKIASKKLDIKSLYFEMNEFDINTDAWYIDCFAFSQDGGLDLEDMEWLCNFETDSQTETETIFQIEGLEELQTAFETTELNTDNLQDSRDWCEQIIIARYMELMRTAHLTAKQEGYPWAKTPIYFTEHSYDFVVKSNS
ncbi:MAG: hypothetical protein DI539_23235 [Flavobacterium psychrophilum]|nr:MAG: hypothetical protein DI539_23235 [Flavobacterium psychrophilum]